MTEADKLADRKYGLPDLATAPVRLFSILVNNAFAAASTTSDNLTLLSLAGGSARRPRRTFQVRVPDRVLPRG